MLVTMKRKISQLNAFPFRGAFAVGNNTVFYKIRFPGSVNGGTKAGTHYRSFDGYFCRRVGVA